MKTTNEIFQNIEGYFPIYMETIGKFENTMKCFLVN